MLDNRITRLTTWHLQITRNRYRIDVAARAIAAIGLGYLLSWMITRELALCLPFSRVNNVVSATLAGLLAYPCAIVWSVAASTVQGAWLGLAVPCVVVVVLRPLVTLLGHVA